MNEFQSGAQVLDNVSAFIGRFLIMSEEAKVACSLFAVATHAMRAFDLAPYLNVCSAEKQCGKSRLLEVLSLIVDKPWLTGRVTPAVLVRKIEAVAPTLLLDETDCAFGGDKEYSSALRGILNQGYRRGVPASLCVGKGSEQQAKDFDVFCPKCFAGIGNLPDTIADRSIPIRLQRKKRDETAERFRWRLAEPPAKDVKKQIADWIPSVLKQLRETYPELPNQLTDRQQEAFEPLLAIADAAGGDWPSKARKAALALFGAAIAEDQSVSTRLLDDIRRQFNETSEEKGFWPKEEIVPYLNSLDDRDWAAYNNGKGIMTNQVNKLLSRYRDAGLLSPKSLRKGEQVHKGYRCEWFTESFERYLQPCDSCGLRLPCSCARVQECVAESV